jgi:hypothetical protein
MKSLVRDMICADPKKRPTMNEVVERFEKIIQVVPKRKLRERNSARNELFVVGLFKDLRSMLTF